MTKAKPAKPRPTARTKPTRPKPAPTSDEIREKFFDPGMQYYIAGRWAVSAGLMPVSGNLLHHAVEMFLKGTLAHFGLEQIKRSSTIFRNCGAASTISDPTAHTRDSMT